MGNFEATDRYPSRFDYRRSNGIGIGFTVQHYWRRKSSVYNGPDKQHFRASVAGTSRLAA
jgi:hypothetical protein